MSKSLMIGAVAGAIFPICFPAAVALAVIAVWYLWSATVVILNRAAEGSFIEKLVHQMHAAAMELNCLIAAAAAFPLTWLRSYHRPRGDLHGRPILLINGYLSFGSTWNYQRKKLVEAGFGPIYTMNIGTGKSIVTYAKQIQEKVRKIQQETGRHDLVLIGHSKGGLVSSYYAIHLAEDEKITDVVTIGSPLAGTPLAYFGPGLDAAEMRSNAQFHQELRASMKEHPEIRFSHIASETDEVVPLSSALSGTPRQLVLKDLGHLSLLYSSRVAGQICAWLSD